MSSLTSGTGGEAKPAGVDPRRGLEQGILVTHQEEMDSAPASLWAVILAGEETSEASVRGTHDDHRPRAPFGSPSLLRQTLNRVRLAIPLERTVVVANRSRPIHLAPEFPVPRAPRLSIQLQDAGTAASVLLAVHWIRRQDSCASVAVFPSEHLMLDPFAFIQHVVKVAHFVRDHDREVVLIGARPTYPDTQYEWIEPGERIPDSASEPVWRVKRLWDKPSYAVARACYDSGFLWNTSVTVARAEALIQASRRLLPELDSRVETAAALAGTEYEQLAVEECYAVARQASFSRSVLAGSPHLLSVSRLPPILWSDVRMRQRILADPNRPENQQGSTRSASIERWTAARTPSRRTEGSSRLLPSRAPAERRQAGSRSRPRRGP